MPTFDPSSPYSSREAPECSKDTSVVPTITPLLVWAQKTLEFAGFEIDILFGSHQNRSEFALMTEVLTIDNPFTYDQSKDKIKWEKSMIVKYDSLVKNKTWTLVPLHPRKNLVGCKRIYKRNFIADGEIEKHKD